MSLLMNVGTWQSVFGSLSSRRRQVFKQREKEANKVSKETARWTSRKLASSDAMSSLSKLHSNFPFTKTGVCTSNTICLLRRTLAFHALKQFGTCNRAI